MSPTTLGVPAVTRSPVAAALDPGGYPPHHENLPRLPREPGRATRGAALLRAMRHRTHGSGQPRRPAHLSRSPSQAIQRSASGHARAPEGRTTGRQRLDTGSGEAHRGGGSGRGPLGVTTTPRLAIWVPPGGSGAALLALGGMNPGQVRGKLEGQETRIRCPPRRWRNA